MTSREQEEWRPVAGYEGLYEVSNLARVRSLPRVAYRENGTPLHLKGSIKKACGNGAGYLHTRLTRDGRSVNMLVHVLVARAFVPNPDNLPDVNHKDLTPLNCLPSNLEWVTHKQNIVHARNGGRLHGYTNKKRRFKLQPEQVAEIRRAKGYGETQKRVAVRHGISREMVGMIWRNELWNPEFENGAPVAVLQ